MAADDVLDVQEVMCESDQSGDDSSSDGEEQQQQQQQPLKPSKHVQFATPSKIGTAAAKPSAASWTRASPSKIQPGSTAVGKKQQPATRAPSVHIAAATRLQSHLTEEPLVGRLRGGAPQKRVHDGKGSKGSEGTASESDGSKREFSCSQEIDPVEVRRRAEQSQRDKQGKSLKHARIQPQQLQQDLQQQSGITARVTRSSTSKNCKTAVQLPPSQKRAVAASVRRGKGAATKGNSEE